MEARVSFTLKAFILAAEVAKGRFHFENVCKQHFHPTVKALMRSYCSKGRVDIQEADDKEPKSDAAEGTC